MKKQNKKMSKKQIICTVLGAVAIAAIIVAICICFGTGMMMGK